MDLPSSRVTPMNTCPGLRPRWCPKYLPCRIQDCCLPGASKPSAFTFSYQRLILMSTTIHISGLNTEPVSLFPLASDSRYRAYPQSSLPACRLRFSWMGLESLSTLTHWVTITNFLPRGGIPKVSDLPRHEDDSC